MSKPIVANLGPFGDAASSTELAHMTELNDSIAVSITPHDTENTGIITNDPEQYKKFVTVGDYFDLTKHPNEMKQFTDYPIPANVKEMVEHPDHYNAGKYECIDILEDILKDLNGFEGFCIGNVVKYCWRLKHKGKPVEDAKKAAFYLKRCIDYMEKKDEKESLS